MSRSSLAPLATAVTVSSLLWAAGPAAAQHQHPVPPPTGPTSQRVTMEQLHAQGGVPRGWKFTLPAGDPARGRQVFADLECYTCHTVRNESFPPTSGDTRRAGPELTGMGAMHPAEYFAESIIAPNRVILEGPGYTGPDGSSIMPSFSDSLSVTQWLDLVAYLKSLTSAADGYAGHAGGSERAVGDYKIRLVFAGAGGAPHDHHAPGDHDAHQHHAPTAANVRTGHLMAFVTDRETSEPVPYLPISATVHVAGQPARTLRLAPMMDRHGFHYGVTVTLPARAHKITLAVGATSMQVTDGGRFKTPVSTVFEWPAP